MERGSETGSETGNNTDQNIPGSEVSGDPMSQLVLPNCIGVLTEAVGSEILFKG